MADECKPIGDALEIAAWHIEYLVLVVEAKLVMASPMITDPGQPVTLKCNIRLIEYCSSMPTGQESNITCDWINGWLYYSSLITVAGKQYNAGSMFTAINSSDVIEGLRAQAAEWAEKNAR